MYHKSLFPPLPDVPEQNVHHALLGRSDQLSWPDFTFQVDVSTGERRSFGGFLERVRDGATALGTPLERGGLGFSCEKRDIVGILSDTCLDYVGLIHSLLAIAVPFVTFSSYSTIFEFRHSLTLSRATRLFVSPSLLNFARSSGLPDDRIYIIGGNVEGCMSYADLVHQVQRRRIPRLPVRRATSDTLAYLIFSSGTTGLPKAVMITHGNIISSILQYKMIDDETVKVQGPQQWNGPDGTEVVLNVLPIHHAYGLHITTFRCFFQPSTILFSAWDEDAYFDTIPKYRVTTLYLVPSLIYQIVHHPRFMTADFSTIQRIQCGAAFLPVQLSQRLQTQFPGIRNVGNGYGMSECTLSISLKPLPGMLDGRAKHVTESVGILMPGMEARVVREDGSLAAVNETGELHVRGCNVSPGYWKNEKATNVTFVDGWLHTGDRMRIDADGVLYFEDRAKDTLKVSGMQVSPMEVEHTILGHPERLVDDVSVAGVSGGRTTDERVPRAWIVLSPAGKALGAEKSVKRIDRWVRDRLSKYKWLRGGIGVVDRIPKSPTGKVLRRQLVDEHEARKPSLARL